MRFSRLAAFLSLVLVSASALAQVELGIISGTITDASGARVPGATIVITNVQTGTAYRTQSDAEGFYRSIPLRAGRYSVTAEAPGFKRALRSGIRLEVQQEASVDLALEVGATTEQITITADAPLLQATEASRGQVIDNKKIVDLPLNGRDYLQLALLTSGTNVPPPGSRFGGFSSSGFRVSHNNYLLDGMDNNSNQHAAQGRTGQVISPSVDAIQEFKVQTSNYSAEFGRNLGGVVNVVIKSGANDLHGGLFEFLRNDVTSARNFFQPPGGSTPPYKRNQFGGLLGGPIRRNKAFFFFDYEGTRQRTSRTSRSTVPTAEERRGDFSQSIFNNRPTQIFDPATYDRTTRARQPFPNNVIPANRLDPVAFKVASFYPLPNQPGVINNFFSNPYDREDTDKFDLRLDHTFSASDSLYGRFSYQNYQRLGEGSLPPPAFGGGDQSTTARNRARSFVVSHGHIFTPALFNTLKLGYNRLLTRRSSPIEENLNQTIGLRGIPVPLPGLAVFTVNGFTGLGTQASTPHDSDSQTRQLTDDLVWVRGRHTVKTGVNLMFVQSPHYQVYQANGTFTFNGNFTRQSSNNTFGNPQADLLLGIPYSCELSSIAQGNQRRRLHSGHVQDDWRLSDRLTLNIGVRYDYMGPWFEKHNRYANFDIDTDRANPRLLLAQPGGIQERSTVSADYNNFAPRVGIAWRVTGGTVLRTGYGIYYGGVDHIGDRFLHAGPPFFFQSAFSTDSINPTVLLRDGFPPGATSARVSNLQTISQDRRNLTPYSQQWNFTLQREMTRDLSLELGYAASKGNRLLQRYDTNAPLPGAGNINARRPATGLEVPGLDYIVTPLADTFRREWSANSNYHGMQVKLEKRLSAGLSFLASYTWSKAISDARGGADAGGTASTGAQDVRNLKAEKSLADEHFPHRFVSSFNYDLPFGRGRTFLANAHPAVNAVFGGWAIGGILTLNSGRPVNLGVQGNPSNTGTPNRPNAAGISPFLSSSERSLQRWFNTDAFARNDPYTFGNVSRNPVQAPGLRNIDFAAYKVFRIAEGKDLQFRAEFFNFTNTPFFGAPGNSLGTGQFGVISGADAARLMQFGLKLSF